MEKIIINGFFAKGNCGDEAILQTWYDFFSDRYEIVACVDGHTLANFTKTKYDFYKNINIINNNSVAFSTDPNVKCLIIGGGGLGLGFGTRQLLHSRLRNKKNYYLGVTVHDEFFDSDDEFIELNKHIFKTFNLISVRDKYSQMNLKNVFDIESLQYPDVATGLKKEEVEIKTENKFITLTVRDYGNNDILILEKWINKIKEFAQKNNFDILCLPFDKGDEILMNKLGFQNKYDDIYWYPKKVKYIISKSEICFSIGRFHPLVFALSESVTPYYIDIKNENSLEQKFEFKNRDKSFYILYDNEIKENYLTNIDLDDIIFEKNQKIEQISKNMNSDIIDFQKTIIESIQKN